jgi:4-diphosphocytidyl-2-C-methyl-D-erythritol kinase
MTGSGSAVFARVLQGFQAARDGSPFEVKLCKNLEVHPLQGWAV